MTIIEDQIWRSALELPPNSRAMLAEQLFKSLDGVKQAEIDELWGELSEKRVQEIEENQVKTLKSEQIFPKLS
jgi:putative addiction module component (TIGR02574 family)